MLRKSVANRIQNQPVAFMTRKGKAWVTQLFIGGYHFMQSSLLGEFMVNNLEKLKTVSLYVE